MTLLSMCAAREGGAAGAPPELFGIDGGDSVQRKRRGLETRSTATAGPSPGSEAALPSPHAAEPPGGLAAPRCPQAPEPPGGSSRKRRAAELKYLGTTLDAHPLELWPRALAQPRTRAADLRRAIGRRVRLLGWPITAKPVLTANEEPMEFVSFEDETAIFEAVLFPDAFRKFRHLLFEEHPLWITGLVERNRGAITLTIESLSHDALTVGSSVR
jgi:hypothetical protein